MRGCIQVRSGHYSLVISGKDPLTNKRTREWITLKNCDSYTKAEKELTRVLREKDTGTYVQPEKVTVKEFIIQWLKSYVETNCRPKTVESYQEIADKHVIPEIGNIRLTSLEAKHLQALYTKKKKDGLSLRTVRYVYSLMSQVLNYGMKQGLLYRNVAHISDPPHLDHKTVNTLAMKDINAFFEAAKETPHYALFYTLLHTGMRRGEVLALKWKNVDMGLSSLGVQAYISVTESLSRIKGTNLLRAPKTQSGLRRIALSPSLTLVLKQHREQQEALFVKLGKRLTDEDFVFCHHDGTLLDPSTISHEFSRILRRAKLPLMPLHGLRHSHATLLLQAGTHPRVVQDRLGHCSIRVTLDTYSHVVGGLQEMAVQKLDDFLAGKTEVGSKMVANQ